jgi:type IV pilus assembly protein PilX
MNPRTAQSGFILVTALVFMTILTLIVTSLFNTTTSEEKIARNFRDTDLALQAAEAAIRDAEIRITGSYSWPYTPVSQTNFDTNCTSGLCDSTAFITRVDNLDFWASSGIGQNSSRIGTLTNSPDLPGIPANSLLGRDYQPRYMIELLCTRLGSQTGASCNKVFRITAQGRGRFPNTRVVLQEVFLPPDLAN